MKIAHLVDIVQALNRANVRYLIVGGLAVNAHGSEGVLAPFVSLSTLSAMKRFSGRPQDLADIAQLKIVNEEH
jgi:hypothetical protein